MHATFVAFYMGKKNYFCITLKGIIDFPNKIVVYTPYKIIKCRISYSAICNITQTTRNNTNYLKLPM